MHVEGRCIILLEKTAIKNEEGGLKFVEGEACVKEDHGGPGWI